MKKLIFIFSFLPLLVFGDDFIIDKVALTTWYDFDLFHSSVGADTFPVFDVKSEDTVYSIVASSTVGFKVNGLRRNYNYNVILPYSATGVVYTTASTSFSITNGLRGTINGSRCYGSICRLPRLQALYSSAASLFWEGYRGPAFTHVFIDGNAACINVNFPTLFADVLASTNTVFRQILLNHLSSIQTSVANIEVNMSGVVSAVEHGNSMLSNVVDNTRSAVESLDIISDSTASINDSVSGINNGVSSLNENVVGAASSLGESLSSSFSAGASSVTNSLSSLQNVASATSQSLTNLNDSVRDGFHYANGTLEALNDNFVKLNPSLVQSNDPSQIEQSFSTDTPFILSEMPTLDPNSPRYQQQLKALEQLSLADYINAVNAVRDPASPFYKKPIDSVLNNRGSLGSINSDNNVSRSFTTNQVLRPLTNEVHNAAIEAATNVTGKLDNLYDRLQGDGLDVRIRFPLYGQDGEAVHVRDDGLDEIGSGLVAGLGDISNALINLTQQLTATNNFSWEPWFDKWDDWTDGVKFSIVENIYSNQYLLFSQYNELVTSDSFWDDLQERSPSMLSNWGFSPSDKNWWHFISSVAMCQAEYVSMIFDNLSVVTNLNQENQIFTDENGEEFGFDVASKKIIRNIPSETAILDQISHFTNSVDVSFVQAATNFLSSCSNRVDNALSVFDGSNSLPSHLAFISATSGGKGILAYGVSVDLSSLANAFSILRTGIAFGLSLVFIFLFPKYCLFWIRRFYTIVMTVFGSFHYGAH